MKCSDSFGWAYFLGIVGSAVYYVQHAVGFWQGVGGIVMAIFWPAVVVYKVFALLGI